MPKEVKKDSKRPYLPSVVIERVISDIPRITDRIRELMKDKGTMDLRSSKDNQKDIHLLKD